MKNETDNQRQEERPTTDEALEAGRRAAQDAVDLAEEEQNIQREPELQARQQAADQLQRALDGQDTSTMGNGLVAAARQRNEAAQDDGKGKKKKNDAILQAMLNDLLSDMSDIEASYGGMDGLAEQVGLDRKDGETDEELKARVREEIQKKIEDGTLNDPDGRLRKWADSYDKAQALKAEIRSEANFAVGNNSTAGVSERAIFELGYGGTIEGASEELKSEALAKNEATVTELSETFDLSFTYNEAASGAAQEQEPELIAQTTVNPVIPSMS